MYAFRPWGGCIRQLAVLCALSAPSLAHAQSDGGGPSASTTDASVVVDASTTPPRADGGATSASEPNTAADGGNASGGESGGEITATRLGRERRERPPSDLRAIDVDAPTREPAGTLNRALEDALQGTRIARSGLRFSLNVFGQTGISIGQGFEPVPANASFSFNAPQFALLVGARLYDEFFALTELVFETGPDNESFVDPERLEVRWRRGRHFVGLGRTHTELGYWNTAFHHGAVLQPTIERPTAVRFEDLGGVIPNHSIGLVAGTGVDFAGGGFNAMIGVSNGRGDLPDDLLIFTDTNPFKSITLKLEFTQFLGTPVRFGVSGSWDRIAATDALTRPRLPDTQIDELFGNAYFVYRGPSLTLITEGYVGAHLPLTPGSLPYYTLAGYAVAGYRFGIVTPYLAFDSLWVEPNNPYYFPDPRAPGPGLTLDPFVGARVDIGDWSAIKVEYHAQHRPAVQQGILHAVQVFWGFGI